MKALTLGEIATVRPQDLYLQALRRLGSVGQAARVAGFNRREPASWRRADPVFAREEQLVRDDLEVLLRCPARPEEMPMAAPTMTAVPCPVAAPESILREVERYQVLDCPERDSTCVGRAVANGWRAFACGECPLVPASVELRRLGVDALMEADDEGFACPECGRAMKNRQGLELHLSRVHAGDEELGCIERREPAPPVVDLTAHRRIRDERDLYRGQLEEALEELNTLRRQRRAAPAASAEEVARLRRQVQELGDALQAAEAGAHAPVVAPADDRLEKTQALVRETGRDVAAMALHARGLESLVQDLERRLAEAQRSDEDHREALVTAQRRYARASRQRRDLRQLLSLAERRISSLEASRERLARAARAVVEGAQEAEACGLPVRVVSASLVGRLRQSIKKES